MKRVGEKLLAFIELGRPVNAAMVFFAGIVGGLIAGAPVHLYLPASLSAALISMGAQAVNDYYDIDVDKRKKKRAPLVRGVLSLKEAKYVWMTYFGLGLIVSLLLTPLHFALAAIAVALSYLYSKAVQRKKYVGNVVVSFLVALTMVYGGMGGEVEKTLLPAVIVFLVNWGREVFKDITDGDADYPKKVSLFHVLGRRWANFFASYLVFLGVIITPFPYLLGYMNKNYVLVMTVAVLIALYALAKALKMDERTAEKVLKAAMGVALLAFLAGAVG